MENNTQILRPLAEKWMDLSALPVMNERRRQWKSMKDLKAERPMILVETRNIINYVSDNELKCEDEFYRNIERQLRGIIRHTEEVGDDIVVEPYFCIGWDIEQSDYGVPLERKSSFDRQGDSIGYVYNHPIQTPEDAIKLKPRSRQVDRIKSEERKQRIQEAFSGVLPVVVHGSQTILAGLTQDLFKLIGNENMMYWIYDEPEILHTIMKFLCEDRLALYEWMENEELLALNNRNEHVGGSYGYVSELPLADYTGRTKLRDLWLWVESQETVTISPEKFAEFFLPYLSEVSKKFGLIYYGCCEQLHDRWELICSSIPNIRAVSISPWSDLERMGEMLGKNYVYSRKPMPAYISGETVYWDQLREDALRTVKAARGCNLEFIFRDVYKIRDRSLLSKWTAMVRSLTNS